MKLVILKFFYKLWQTVESISGEYETPKVGALARQNEAKKRSLPVGRFRASMRYTAFERPVHHK